MQRVLGSACLCDRCCELYSVELPWDALVFCVFPLDMLLWRVGASRRVFG